MSSSFKLGRNKWFALRRLITNSRNSAFTGDFWNRFLKETSQLQSKGQELPNRRTNSKWPTDGWKNRRQYYPLMWPSFALPWFFPCRHFWAENSVIFFYEIRVLFTLFTYSQSMFDWTQNRFVVVTLILWIKAREAFVEASCYLLAPCTRAIDRSSRANYRSILVLTSLANTCAYQDAWVVITPKRPKANSIRSAAWHAWTRTQPRNIVQKSVFSEYIFPSYLSAFGHRAILIWGDRDMAGEFC